MRAPLQQKGKILHKINLPLPLTPFPSHNFHTVSNLLLKYLRPQTTMHHGQLAIFHLPQEARGWHHL